MRWRATLRASARWRRRWRRLWAVYTRDAQSCCIRWRRVLHEQHRKHGGKERQDRGSELHTDTSECSELLVRRSSDGKEVNECSGWGKKRARLRDRTKAKESRCWGTRRAELSVRLDWAFYLCMIRTRRVCIYLFVLVAFRMQKCHPYVRKHATRHIPALFGNLDQRLSNPGRR